MNPIVKCPNCGRRIEMIDIEEHVWLTEFYGECKCDLDWVKVTVEIKVKK